MKRIAFSRFYKSFYSKMTENLMTSHSESFSNGILVFRKYLAKGRLPAQSRRRNRRKFRLQTLSASEEGYTLVEILISAAFIGALAVIGAKIFTTITRGSIKVQSIKNARQEAVAFSSRINLNSNAAINNEKADVRERRIMEYNIPDNKSFPDQGVQISLPNTETIGYENTPHQIITTTCRNINPNLGKMLPIMNSKYLKTNVFNFMYKWEENEELCHIYCASHHYR